jgi:hypothetical protein
MEFQNTSESDVNSQIRQVLIHVGFGKTGSTAIQNMLYGNRKQLSTKGISYTDSQELAGNVQSGNIGSIFHYLQDKPDKSKLIDLISHHIIDDQLAILSNELLPNLSTRNLELFFECLNELDTEFKLLAYVRSPLNWYISAYNQSIKRHGFSEDFDMYLDKNTWPHLSYIQKFNDLGIVNNLKIISYDRASGSLFHSFWESVYLMFGRDFRGMINEDEHLHNRALRLCELNLLKSINRISGDLYSMKISDFLIDNCHPIGPKMTVSENAAEQIVSRHSVDVHLLNNKYFSGENIIDFSSIQSTLGPEQSEDVLPDSNVLMKIIELILNQKNDGIDTKHNELMKDLSSMLKSFDYFEVMPDGNIFDNVFYYLNHPGVFRAGLRPIDHYLQYGIHEDRLCRILPKSKTSMERLHISKAFDEEFPREIIDRNGFADLAYTTGDVLEIGPFTSPLLKGDNVFYADVLCTDDLKERAINLNLDPVNIPSINYVVEPSDLTSIDREFASVLSSHCIEHQPNLIGHLTQVSALLQRDGCYFLLIPDHRYCFDHFKTESSVAQMIAAHTEKRYRHSIVSLIEERELNTHNDSVRHWAGDHGDLNRDRSKLIKQALIEFENQSPNYYKDQHAWYFTPDSFTKSVKVLADAEVIDFEVASVYPTKVNSNEFWVILRKISR